MVHPYRGEQADDTAQCFAHGVKAGVTLGEISGAVAAVATGDLARMEAFGWQDVASGARMRLDTIFRMASAAKPIFAAAALVLLEDGKFDLTDDITRWAPELADRRVLRSPDSELDDTVAAQRPITMFDVLTFQLGIGMYIAMQDTPLLRAMFTLGIAPATEPIPFGPDQFLSRLGTLPFAHQAGETFMYHTGEDILRCLIPRIANQPFGEFLEERVFAPLAMRDSGLSVPAAKLDRFSTCYLPQAGPGDSLVAWDEPQGRFAEDPLFPNTIVSTAGDYLKFASMLLGRGSAAGRQFLRPESVALMMTDHLRDEQKRRSPAPDGFWQTRGWGMGATVYTQSIPQGPHAGSYSWFGGYGPHLVVDPVRGSSLILMMPRVVQSYQHTALGYQFELDTYRDIIPDQ